MKKFMFFFWRLLGMAAGAAFIAALNFGMIQHSWAIAFSFIQKILVISAGVTAAGGLAVILEKYVENHTNNKEDKNVLG